MDRPALSGLRIFVTHIKEALVPHPTGKSAREIIMSELRALEEGPEGGLGVEFIEVKKGDRICECNLLCSPGVFGGADRFGQ